jgi:tripartite-type tricarboxylate transporter receptor subunit TctC
LAEKLGKGKDELAMLRAIHATFQMNLPVAVAPEVPKDRVQALRKAYEKAYADPEVRKVADKMKMDLSPKSGEEVSRIVQELLNTPKPVLTRLKEVIQ